MSPLTNSTNDKASAEQPSSASVEVGDIRRQRPRKRASAYLEAYTLPGLLVIAFIFFSVWPKTSGTFPTSANLQVLLGSNSVIAIVALAALVPLVCNEWDLSVGATATLSSVFAAEALSNGTSPWLAILLGIGIGLAVGLVNTLIVTRFGVNAVITTLGVSIIIPGIISLKTKGLAVGGNIPQSVLNFGTMTWLGIPRTVYALAVVAIAVYYALEHTPFGRYLYAVGSNRAAARLVGIRLKLLVGLTFLIAGGLCGAAGVIQVARAGGASPSLADTLLLPALAAAFLSAAAIRPGRPNVAGVLVAVYFIAVLNSGLNLAGAQPYVANFVNGGALIIGVGLAARLGHRQEL